MQKTLFTIILILFTSCAFAQDDLLDLLGEDETAVPETEYIKASFKTTRVINAHSLENTAGGVLDIKISHRFGFLNGGLYELFGLDQATIRIGGDYGITDWLMVGLGRSSFEKTYDGFVKFKLIRQSQGAKQIPITLAFASNVAIKTLEWRNLDRENYFSSRLTFTHQFILGRKFSESTTLQLMPTLVHRNLVEMTTEKNDVLALGIAGRQKLSKRIALNFEYYYVLPDQILDKYTNSLSLGFDIETGGHVFQLHFTNSTSMIEKGFVTETVGNWLNGDIHFGFNVSRVFTVKKRKRK
ncbi:MAG: DUF5777 family beta-barrel protein [Chitinophagales bacterium]